MKLSNRLQAILDLVPQGSRLADIGTDHGHLIVRALLDNKVNYAYALDIAEKPLNQAKNNIEQYKLIDRSHCELRNGLEGFQGDANCFVIAGMGAETILGIINGYTFKNHDILIIQSNTKVPWLRTELSMRGFKIVDEVFLIDKKIPTFIMKCEVVGYSQNLDLTQKWVGPVLMKSVSDIYIDHLDSRIAHLKKIKQHDPELDEEYTVLSNFINI